MPAYLKWRDGRPRWEPGPKLRAAGHQGRDLKDETGAWLTLGAAVDAAGAINAAIAGDSTAAQARPPARSLGALLDIVEAQPKFRDDGAKGVRLAHTTLINYRCHFGILRGWAAKEAVAAIKRSDIALFYDELVQARGVPMANRCMAALRTVLLHARDLHWITHSPIQGLKMVPEDGRLVMWTPDEHIAFVRCADWLGLESVADAHLVALMTAQSRKDVLAMPELDLDQDVFRLKRRKTSRVAFVPATEVLTARIAMMRRRKTERWPGVAYDHEIVSSRTGAPYALDGSTFTHEYRMVRAVASGLQQALDQVFPDGAPGLDYAAAPFRPIPTIWDKRFADLRDTAITLLYELCKGDIAKVANISGHSSATAQAVIEKHYHVRHAEMSRGVGALVDGFMQKIGFAG